MTNFYFFGVLLLFVALGFVIVPLLRISNWRLIILLTVLFPLVSLGLYWHWGSSNAIADFLFQQQQIAEARKELANYKNVNEIIEKLKSHLQQHPASAKGWYLLGRLYYISQQYSEAVNAFTKAKQLQPNEASISLQLAWSMAARDKQIRTK